VISSVFYYSLRGLEILFSNPLFAGAAFQSKQDGSSMETKEILVEIKTAKSL